MNFVLSETFFITRISLFDMRIIRTSRAVLMAREPQNNADNSSDFVLVLAYVLAPRPSFHD
jgi:hypothetical protein